MRGTRARLLENALAFVVVLAVCVVTADVLMRVVSPQGVRQVVRLSTESVRGAVAVLEAVAGSLPAFLVMLVLMYVGATMARADVLVGAGGDWEADDGDGRDDPAEAYVEGELTLAELEKELEGEVEAPDMPAVPDPGEEDPGCAHAHVQVVQGERTTYRCRDCHAMLIMDDNDEVIMEAEGHD